VQGRKVWHVTDATIGTQPHVVCWKSTDVSDKHVGSIFVSMNKLSEKPA
jgi:hypothetical protein